MWHARPDMRQTLSTLTRLAAPQRTGPSSHTRHTRARGLPWHAGRHPVSQTRECTGRGHRYARNPHKKVQPQHREHEQRGEHEQQGEHEGSSEHLHACNKLRARAAGRVRAAACARPQQGLGAYCESSLLPIMYVMVSSPGRGWTLVRPSHCVEERRGRGSNGSTRGHAVHACKSPCNSCVRA